MKSMMKLGIAEELASYSRAVSIENQALTIQCQVGKTLGGDRQRRVCRWGLRETSIGRTNGKSVETGGLAIVDFGIQQCSPVCEGQRL